MLSGACLDEFGVIKRVLLDAFSLYNGSLERNTKRYFQICDVTQSDVTQRAVMSIPIKTMNIYCIRIQLWHKADCWEKFLCMQGIYFDDFILK